MTDILKIEDDDGFRTEYAWPLERTMLANEDFVRICIKHHDQQRKEEGLDV